MGVLRNPGQSLKAPATGARAVRALLALAVVCLLAGCFASEPTIRLKDKPKPAASPLPAIPDEGSLGRWLPVGTWEIPAEVFETPWALKLRMHVEGPDRCRLNFTSLSPVAREPFTVAKVWALRNGTVLGYADLGPHTFLRVGPASQPMSQSFTVGFGASFLIGPKTDWVSFAVLAKPESKGPFRLSLECNHLPLSEPQWWASRQVLHLTDDDAFAAAAWGDGVVTLRGEGSRVFDGDVASYFGSRSDLGEYRLTHPGGTRTWSLDRRMVVEGFTGPSGLYRVEYSRVGARSDFYFFWSLTVGWQAVDDPGKVTLVPA